MTPRKPRRLEARLLPLLPQVQIALQEEELILYTEGNGKTFGIDRNGFYERLKKD